VNNIYFYVKIPVGGLPLSAVRDTFRTYRLCLEAVFCIRNLRTHPAVGRWIYNLEFTHLLADNLRFCAESFETLLRMLPEMYPSSLIFSLTINYLSTLYGQLKLGDLLYTRQLLTTEQRGCVCYMRLHSCCLNYRMWICDSVALYTKKRLMLGFRDNTSKLKLPARI